MIQHVEPSLWSQFASYWLYLSFLHESSETYERVLAIVLTEFRDNPNLGLFDEFALRDFLRLM